MIFLFTAHSWAGGRTQSDYLGKEWAKKAEEPGEFGLPTMFWEGSGGSYCQRGITEDHNTCVQGNESDKYCWKTAEG